MKEGAADSSAVQARGYGDGTGPCPVLVHKGPSATPAAPTDPDLARVIDAWPDLPAHLRAAFLALVGTAPAAKQAK
jgi:hypothetical protein